MNHLNPECVLNFCMDINPYTLKYSAGGVKKFKEDLGQCSILVPWPQTLSSKAAGIIYGEKNMQIANTLLLSTILSCSFSLLSVAILANDSSTTVVNSGFSAQIDLEQGSQLAQPTATTTVMISPSEQPVLININTATAAQIADSLKRIGNTILRQIRDLIILE
jgi:hypothetical protein